MARKPKPFVQCGRTFTKQEIKDIQEIVDMFPRLSRSELAKTVSENLEWFTLSGSVKTDAPMKLMEKLEAKKLIKLPVKRDLNNRKPHKKIAITSKTDPPPPVTGQLKHLEWVDVEVVQDKERYALWKEYIMRYHYLQYKKPFGFFMNYFINCDRGELGCALFAGAANSIGMRDHWIGWTPNQRARNQAYVIQNIRFLIFPWVNVKNLASYAMGKILRHICDDWENKWGYRPVLAETFVEPTRYKGTCYKATNWQFLGMTTGEGNIRQGKAYATTPKRLFVLPLAKDFRKTLCAKQAAPKANQL